MRHHALPFQTIPVRRALPTKDAGAHRQRIVVSGPWTFRTITAGEFATRFDEVSGRTRAVARLLWRCLQVISHLAMRRPGNTLHLESLSDHLRRDLGLTNHVEQPSPARRR
jgi:uncharacterized protein YjiS (DUF1127 family)